MTALDASPARLRSALYVGRVMHHRFQPRTHHFDYPIYMHLLDLDELPALEERLWLFGHSRARPVRFRERDHLGDPQRPLRENVRSFLCEHGVQAGSERILLLTQCRVAGYVFNPVSFYYCYAPGGALAAIVAEVHNTFGETHPYLLTGEAADGFTGTEKKVFHVSPFMTLDGTYAFELTAPAERLLARIDLHRGGERLFASRLTLERRPLTNAALLELLLRYPLTPLRVITTIYWEALHLWRKRISYHHKPPYDPEGARRGVA